MTADQSSKLEDDADGTSSRGQHGEVVSDTGELPLWSEEMPWLEGDEASAHEPRPHLQDLDSHHGKIGRERQDKDAPARNDSARSNSLAEQTLISIRASRSATSPHSGEALIPSRSSKPRRPKRTESPVTGGELNTNVDGGKSVGSSRRGRRLAISATAVFAGIIALTVTNSVSEGFEPEKEVAAPVTDSSYTEPPNNRPGRSDTMKIGGKSHSFTSAAEASATEGSEPAATASDSLNPTATPSETPTSISQASPQTHPATVRPSASPTASQASRTIYATAVLNPGESVSWGKGTLAMTSTGNLIVTDENGTTRWATHTSGSTLQTVFQDDGCLAIYSAAHIVVWSSYTNGHPGAVFVMTASGNMQIKQGSAVLWQTGTGH